MKYLALLIGLILVVPAFGQKKKDGTQAPAFTEGVVYALPRTGVRVQIQAIKETFQPGPYAGYAEQLLGIKNAKTRASVTWNIDDIKIETFSEPDPDQIFKALGEGASSVSLTSDGCIAGISTMDSDNKKDDVVTNHSGNGNKLSTPDYFQYLTDSPGYKAGDSTNNYKPVKMADDQKISKAAQRVLECRRLQYEIAAGLVDELHPDGEAYKVSLKELKQIELDYLSLFVGKSTFDKANFSFDYMPKSGGKSEAIFRISEDNGIVPASDLSGKPVMIEFEIEKELAQKYAGLVKSDNPSAGSSGVFYRIPGRANIKIVNEMNVIASARATIAQFGAVAPVPEDLLLGDFSIGYNTETGAIKSVIRK